MQRFVLLGFNGFVPDIAPSEKQEPPEWHWRGQDEMREKAGALGKAPKDGVLWCKTVVLHPQ
ncbi:hypothetical protein GCM10025784_26500 [Citricoccus nitrophenolicus]